jgi:polysaccharide chain length determinant protein (PEP-CTERM system associated)
VYELLLEVLSQARSAWRFRWYGVAVAWLVAIGGWTAVGLMPDVYEASTRVYVDTSSILRPLLNDNIVPTDVTTRLQFVRQALLGREYLERIAAKNGLDATATTPAERERMLERVRASANIQAIPARDEVNRETANTIFHITFRHERPEVAVGVVTDFLNILIEDTLSANREGTDTAERFLDERIREYENRLQQAEQALAEFQRKNAGRLPGSEGGYFERMQREREAIEQAERAIRLAESRRAQLERQLSGEAPVSPAVGVEPRDPPPNSIDARIRDYRLQLDRLLIDFTEQHPDVVAVREALARLEAQRAEQLRALGIDDPEQQISSLGTNPVYQALQIAVNEVQVEIATLRTDVEDRRRRLAELQALVEEVPEVEAELQRLNRDYDDIRRQYQLLIQSRETQMLSRKASEADQVEFRVLNPPQAGFQPVAPRRLLLVAGVLAGALAAGAGLCYLLAQVKPVFSNTRMLSEISGLPVLGAVSRVLVNAEARRKQRLSVLAFSAAMAGLAVAFGAVVLIEAVGPGLRNIVMGA